VSLPSDIIQLFGTSSVPVIVAGSVLGVFELGERLASQRAKDALSKWLVSFDIQKTKALPDGTQDLFERIFGERHFSLTCFIRSAAFSLGATIFIGVLFILIWPQELAIWKDTFFKGWLFFPGRWLISVLWLPWTIVIDYVSLLKTRLVLRTLTRLRNNLLALGILGADYIIYSVLFVISFITLEALSIYINVYSHPQAEFSQFLYLNIDNVTDSMLRYPSSEDVVSVFFWAGFAPSIWMWLYVTALFVTRALLRSERIVNWLRWSLAVEKNPFRSIGAVAATLAFIASVAIILVSAVVSRISTAL
jgi:hypothetical protein